MSLIRKAAATLAFGAAAAVSAAIVPPLAQAQPAYEETTAGGDVTITAPRVERDPATGAEIDVVYTTRIVSYADLDLNTRWGMRTLHHRIVRAANDACSDLSMRYVTVDNDADCVNTAVRHALYQSPLRGDAYDGMAD